MERIVSLGRSEAIKAIADSKYVMLRSGVWNSYHKAPLEKATECILQSGYGADVYFDGIDYYVSCPCDSDMW